MCVCPDWATGQMILDENGDRDPFFWIFDLHKEGHFQVVAEVTHRHSNGQEQRVRLCCLNDHKLAIHLLTQFITN